MEFRGGTYISQVEDSSLDVAMYKWAENLPVNEIQYIGKKSKNELIKRMLGKEDYPVLLEGMDNVWCYSGCLKVGFFLVNIVAS